MFNSFFVVVATVQGNGEKNASCHDVFQRRNCKSTAVSFAEDEAQGRHGRLLQANEVPRVHLRMLYALCVVIRDVKKIKYFHKN